MSGLGEESVETTGHDLGYLEEFSRILLEPMSTGIVPQVNSILRLNFLDFLTFSIAFSRYSCFVIYDLSSRA